MSKAPVPEKVTRHHSTKTEKTIRLAVENRLQGGKFVPVVPKKFTVEEAKAYKWLCSVLEPADVLGEPDRETLELAAVTIARINQLDDMARENTEYLLSREFNMIRNSYISQYFTFCKELCLSPGARAKIGAIAVSRKAEDPLLKVLNG